MVKTCDSFNKYNDLDSPCCFMGFLSHDNEMISCMLVLPHTQKRENLKLIFIL